MKKILFVLIITIALILGVSCDGSGPAAPASNNSSDNGSAAKTVCYIFQHPVIGMDISNPSNHCAYIASTTLENNEDHRYLLNFDGNKLDIIERVEGDTPTNSGIIYPSDGENYYENVLEQFSSGDSPAEYHMTDTPSEAQNNLMWRSVNSNGSHSWGYIKKIGETNNRIYYAVCPLISTFTKDPKGSGILTGYSWTSELVDQKAFLYYCFSTITNIEYKKTVNGIEYYDVTPENGDTLEFYALDDTFLYTNIESGLSFGYEELTENGWNANFDSNPDSTILTMYSWIFQDSEKWNY